MMPITYLQTFIICMSSVYYVYSSHSWISILKDWIQYFLVWYCLSAFSLCEFVTRESMRAHERAFVYLVSVHIGHKLDHWPQQVSLSFWLICIGISSRWNHWLFTGIASLWVTLFLTNELTQWFYPLDVMSWDPIFYAAQRIYRSIGRNNDRIFKKLFLWHCVVSRLYIYSLVW